MYWCQKRKTDIFGKQMFKKSENIAKPKKINKKKDI